MKCNKVILIVGAGFGQIPAIEKSKSLGFKVVVIDRNPNAQGMKMADYSYAIDVVDKEKALEIAKKHKVNGVMTMQSDLPVPTIGYLNDKLNLNGVSEEVALNCSNKINTREKLLTEKCSQPNFRIVSTIYEASNACREIGFPCVIKAPDSSGSRGVVKVKSEQEISDAYTEAFKYTNGKEILVEEYIEGLEFGAQTFSVNGTCEKVLLHSDILSSPPYMIPVGHSFPFEDLLEKDRLRCIEDVKKAVESLGIFEGPANVDFILDKNTKRVKILEVGARIGATCLPELVHFHTGIDWVEQTILNSLGEKVNLEVKKNVPVTAIIFEADKDGVLQGYEFPNDKVLLKELVEYEITANLGDPVRILRKGTDRIGKVICKGETVSDSIDNCLNFIEKTKIEIN